MTNGRRDNATGRGRRGPGPVRVPTSTYRLQLHAGFTFTDAHGLVPYLDDLGVTDVYCSPLTLAAAGSTHGYDVCNHTRLNPELGSEADYDTLCAALASRDMGQVLDFVPNHMSIDPHTNEWWRDMLENGPSSPFAPFFDIDWDPVKPELRDRVLLPILGDQYGRVLHGGELALVVERGALALRYGDTQLPVNPRQVPRVFAPWLDELTGELGVGHPAAREFLSIMTALRNLPSYTEREPERVAERQREKEVARERLARLLDTVPSVARFVDTCLRRVNGDRSDPRTFGMLHDLLEVQAYRLAYWQTAFDEINYRRFFDINHLAGLCVEDQRVFDTIHTLVVRLVEEGKVTGVRIDHPDGLFAPGEYFARLQGALLRALASRSGQGAAGLPKGLSTDRPVYLLAEKTLTGREALPEGWAVHGTTGYNFLNDLNGLFVDPDNAESLRRIYRRLTGQRAPFADVVYESKKLIMLTALASELNVLAHALNRLSEASPLSRDFTLSSLRKALMEVVACFPIYRTYWTPGGTTAADRAAVDKAVSDARRRNPAMERSIFDFIRRSVLLDDPASQSGDDEQTRLARQIFAMKFQQYTGPVQAKGLEDTAFYRHGALLSVNEVGGDASIQGVTPEEFHQANAARLERWPLEMTTTMTHDAKRGEDARARLNVISEMPDSWRRHVSSWMRMNADARTAVDGEPAPDRNDEYMFYQALVGAWPAEPPTAAVPTKATEQLVGRLVEYMRKATKEAKRHTSWINANEAYDLAVTHFVERTLRGSGSRRFLESLVPFVRRVARYGAINSLAQVTLRLAAPGVPDLYQGCELWDFSLVDPDNRRPVEFARRRAWLAELRPVLDTLEAADDQPGRDVTAEVAAMVAGWHDGRIKLLLTARCLRYRRRFADLFRGGSYLPLTADDLSRRHVVGFARQLEGHAVMAVAPRFTTQLPRAVYPPVGVNAWAEAPVRIPGGVRGTRVRHLFTGESIPVQQQRGAAWVSVADLLRTCPVAWVRVER